MYLPLKLPLFLPTERQGEPEGFAELEFLLAELVTRATERAMGSNQRTGKEAGVRRKHPNIPFSCQ